MWSERKLESLSDEHNRVEIQERKQQPRFLNRNEKQRYSFFDHASLLCLKKLTLADRHFPSFISVLHLNEDKMCMI